EQPHEHGVDIGDIELDLRVLRRHLAGLFQEDAARGAQDIGFVHGGDPAPSVTYCVIERGFDDPAGRLVRDAADGDGGIGRNRFGAAQSEYLGGNGREFDSDIHALGVFAEDHQVDVVAVVQRVAAECLAGSQACIEVEQLPHADDGAAVREAA